MAHEFLVIIEQGEDGYLIADVPELPGCHTQGKNEAELMNNVHEAIELYLEVKGAPTHPKVVSVRHVTV